MFLRCVHYYSVNSYRYCRTYHLLLGTGLGSVGVHTTGGCCMTILSRGTLHVYVYGMDETLPILTGCDMRLSTD